MIPGIAPAIVHRIGSGLLFQEDWSGFSAGDGIGDLATAGYDVSRLGGGSASIETVAAAPNGIALGLKSSGNYVQARVSLIDADDVISGGDWSFVDVCASVRSASSSGSAHFSIGQWLTTGISGDLYGIYITRDSASHTKLILQLASAQHDIGTIENGTAAWVRVRFEDDDISVKLWTGDYDLEPVAWAAVEALASGVVQDIIERIEFAERSSSSNNTKLLGYAIGVDTPAAPDWA